MTTTHPTEQISYEQWVREFNVSTKYVDHKVKEMISFDDVINYNRFIKNLNNKTEKNGTS